MKINYDKDADALYIELSNAEFDTNKKINESTILDLDKDNSIIGIEILDASKRISKESLSQIEVKNIIAKQG